jgi:guanine deaminase
LVKAIRGRLLWYVSDPETDGPAARRYHEDGLLVVENGPRPRGGDAEALLRTLPPGTPVADHRPHLVMPGFIDAHIHYPQSQVVASFGATLLEWLERYTFVEEQLFADPDHAAAGARFFLDELLRVGRRRPASIAPSIRARPRRSLPNLSGAERAWPPARS